MKAGVKVNAKTCQAQRKKGLQMRDALLPKYRPMLGKNNTENERNTFENGTIVRSGTEVKTYTLTSEILTVTPPLVGPYSLGDRVCQNPLNQTADALNAITRHGPSSLTHDDIRAHVRTHARTRARTHARTKKGARAEGARKHVHAWGEGSGTLILL